MSFNDDSYDNFNKNDINNLGQLNFDFVLEHRFIHVKDNEGNYFKCQTPFLKVLKPIHTTLNKKKSIAKKYIILETNDELDFNNQIGEFMFIINKLHEISQEKIRENSISWFNTEFDDIGLDIKVKRPIDQNKYSEFIKLSIPDNLDEKVSNLVKGNYVLSNIQFKGLKVSNDYIYEEWELIDLITQEKYDELLKEELSQDSSDFIQDLLENNKEEEILVQENVNTTDDIKVIYVKESSENIDIVNQESESNNDDGESKIIILENTESKKNKKDKIIRKKNSDLIKKFSKKIIFN